MAALSGCFMCQYVVVSCSNLWLFHVPVSGCFMCQSGCFMSHSLVISCPTLVVSCATLWLFHVPLSGCFMSHSLVVSCASLWLFHVPLSGCFMSHSLVADGSTRSASLKYTKSTPSTFLSVRVPMQRLVTFGCFYVFLKCLLVCAKFRRHTTNVTI